MKRLNRLSQIADLLLDAKLVKLREAARARDESLSHLAALQVAAAPADDPLLSARVAVRYEGWADTRRAAINVTLARQTAEWMDAQDDARAAFGRAQVLARLKAR